MNRKYELTKCMTLAYDYTPLYRIQALRDFSNVKAGDFGGYIKSEDNLSHEGNCWVYDNARVSENAQIIGGATVCGNARIFGSATISAYAWIQHNIQINFGVWTNTVRRNNRRYLISSNMEKILIGNSAYCL